MPSTGTIALIVLQLASMPVWGETAAPHSKFNRENELEVKRNRVQTETIWAGAPIKFPCADAIAQRRKLQLPLPRLVVNGESHTHTYCRERKDRLFSLAGNTDGEYCVAWEAVSAPLELGADRRVIKGLENPLVKELDALLIAYQSIKTSQRESYITRFPVGLILYSKISDILAEEAVDSQATQRLKKDILAIKERFMATENLLSKLDTAAFHGVVPTVPSGEVLVGMGGVMGVLIKNLPLQKRKLGQQLEDLIFGNREAVAAMFEVAIEKLTHRIENQKNSREDVKVPFRLKKEVRYALRSIDQIAESPQDDHCRSEFDACVDFMQGWRDRLMAVNLAAVYCENLTAVSPKQEVHAIVGQAHAHPMLKLLKMSAEYNGLELSEVNGVQLANLDDLFRGTPNEDGRYPNRPIEKLLLGETSVGLALQQDGLRIVVQESFFDPLPGTSLSKSEQPGAEVKVFTDSKVWDAFVKKSGLSGKSQIEQRNALAAYLRKLYEARQADGLRAD